MSNRKGKSPDEKREFIILIIGGPVRMEIAGASQSHKWFINRKSHFRYALIAAAIIG